MLFLAIYIKCRYLRNVLHANYIDASPFLHLSDRIHFAMSFNRRPTHIAHIEKYPHHA